MVQSWGYCRISLTKTTFEDFFIRYTFEYFSAEGTVISTSPTFTLTVNKPVTLITHWKKKELKIASMVLPIVVAVIFLLIILLVILVTKRKRR